MAETLPEIDTKSKYDALAELCGSAQNWGRRTRECETMSSVSGKDKADVRNYAV